MSLKERIHSANEEALRRIVALADGWHAAFPTAEGLEAGLRELRPSHADGIFYVNDAMVLSQADQIIETAKALRALLE